jgi:hypothetical protein
MTAVSSTHVVVVTRDTFKAAASLGVAGVFGTFVVIIASNFGVFTASHSATRVVSTGVVIIAVNGFVFAAISGVAGFSSTFVVIITFNVDVCAAGLTIAIIGGTSITIVTFNSFIVAGIVITRFSCTFAVVITRVFSVFTAR